MRGCGERGREAEDRDGGGNRNRERCGEKRCGRAGWWGGGGGGEAGQRNRSRKRSRGGGGGEVKCGREVERERDEGRGN